jgi:hypothetical protein
VGYDNAVCANTTTSYTGLQYNGNIAGMLWKSAGDGAGWKYDFRRHTRYQLNNLDDLKNELPQHHP